MFQAWLFRTSDRLEIFLYQTQIFVCMYVFKYFFAYIFHVFMRTCHKSKQLNWLEKLCMLNRNRKNSEYICCSQYLEIYIHLLPVVGGQFVSFEILLEVDPVPHIKGSICTYLFKKYEFGEMHN